MGSDGLDRGMGILPMHHGSPQATRRGELESRATVLADFKRSNLNPNRNAIPTGGDCVRGQGWGLDARGNAPSPKRLWCVGDWLRRVVHAADEWPGRLARGDWADF